MVKTVASRVVADIQFPLGSLEHFPADDGFVAVCHDDPFFFRHRCPLLGLVVADLLFVVHHISAVDLIPQNLPYRLIAPAERTIVLLIA